MVSVNRAKDPAAEQLEPSHFAKDTRAILVQKATYRFAATRSIEETDGES
jgi:hypothetical protein